MPSNPFVMSYYHRHHYYTEGNDVLEHLVRWEKYLAKIWQFLSVDADFTHYLFGPDKIAPNEYKGLYNWQSLTPQIPGLSWNIPVGIIFFSEAFEYIIWAIIIYFSVSLIGEVPNEWNVIDFKR